VFGRAPLDPRDVVDVVDAAAETAATRDTPQTRDTDPPETDVAAAETEADIEGVQILPVPVARVRWPA